MADKLTMPKITLHKIIATWCFNEVEISHND